MKTALIIYGGWDGHQPKECADLFSTKLTERGFTVTASPTLDVLLDKAKTAKYDLIVPIWTMDEISTEQRESLCSAVAAGSGLAGFHGGMGDAFRKDTEYQFMVGGQFVGHPDNIKEYEVNLVNTRDAITDGLSDFTIKSEQYYMHIDPSNEVLATTTFETVSAPWVNGTVMPVVWKRQYNLGRVFYSSIGHQVSDFQVHEALEIQLRGMSWASR